MKFSADDKAAMLDALGDDAVVAGGIPRVLFQAPGEVLDGIGGVITTNPTAVIADGDVTTYGLVGGENGSGIAIDTVEYAILAIVPDGDGFSTLTLELA